MQTYRMTYLASVFPGGSICLEAFLPYSTAPLNLMVIGGMWGKDRSCLMLEVAHWPRQCALLQHNFLGQRCVADMEADMGKALNSSS